LDQRRLYAAVRLLSFLAIVVAACGDYRATAQTLHPAEQQIIDTLDTETDKARGSVLRLGLGPVTTSRLGPGGRTSVYALPLIFYSYRDVINLDEAELRINMLSDWLFPGSGLSDSGFNAGPTVKVDFGRRPFGSGVHGAGNVGTSVEVGGFASYSFGPARIRARLRQDIGDGHNGAVAEIDLRSGLYRHNGFGISAQVGTTWADRQYMQSVFGVTPVQSTPSLAAYIPHGDFRDLRASVISEYKFAGGWSAAASVQYVRRRGDAAQSPIVSKNGSLNRLNTGVFLLYTFGQ
jgi:outer membrane scaffolding protein for murein synthesis (MipA/OmpV family)